MSTPPLDLGYGPPAVILASLSLSIGPVTPCPHETEPDLNGVWIPD